MERKYTYIVTYPDGKLLSVCGAVFDSIVKAQDALFDAFYDNYYIKPTAFTNNGANYHIFRDAYSANRNVKYLFNAQVIAFEVID